MKTDVRKDSKEITNNVVAGFYKAALAAAVLFIVIAFGDKATINDAGLDFETAGVFLLLAIAIRPR